MSESVYFITLGLILGTILIVFGMRYFALVQQARAQSAASGANVDTAAALKSLAASMADAQARLAGIEKILKQVE